MRKILALGLSFVLSGASLFAWGPMTHMKVNAKALARASGEMGNSLVITNDTKGSFIALGACPDIKQTGGASFPYAFHDNIETIERMIERAKNDSRFGLTDVIEALGWAGHLFAEVTSAHAKDGYPNNKITATVPNCGAVNHQINEFAVDILSFREEKETLKRLGLSLPMRLLEASMKAEKEDDPSRKAMTATEIRVAGDAFIPTVAGIRSIADYLIKERPELLEEMDSFYEDRHDAVEISITEVAGMLRKHGNRDFSKSFAGSADGKDKVKIALSGDFKAKIKGLAYDLLFRSLKSGVANDIFSFSMHMLMKGMLSNDFSRDSFMDFAGGFSGAKAWGGEGQQMIVKKFLLAVVSRHDLTFPEIIAYAQEGIAPDEANLARQKKQFKDSGLTEDGRKPTTLAQVIDAVKEVERIESVRNDWPWFWPFRPSAEKLAFAREKAGRLLAYHFSDRNTLSPSLQQKGRDLLSRDRAFRGKLWETKYCSLFHPIKKWNLTKERDSFSDSFGKEQKYLANLAGLLQTLGEPVDSGKAATLVSQTSKRLREIEYALEVANTRLKKLSILQIAARSETKDEIKRLEAARQNLRESLSALQSVQNDLSAPSVQALSATDPESEPEATVATDAASLAALNAKYQKVYSRYAALLREKSGDDPEVRKTLAELENLVRLRRKTRASTP